MFKSGYWQEYEEDSLVLQKLIAVLILVISTSFLIFKPRMLISQALLISLCDCCIAKMYLVAVLGKVNIRNMQYLCSH